MRLETPAECRLKAGEEMVEGITAEQWLAWLRAAEAVTRTRIAPEDDGTMPPVEGV